MSKHDNNGDLPEFEVPPLSLAALQLKEMYDSFRNAGFSRSEALTLVSKIITDSINNGPVE